MQLFNAPEAKACGGFFCSQVPIEQSGETIIFGVDKEESKVTATIQINYQGEAKDFAWVIPVMSAPEISLAGNLLFATAMMQHAAKHGQPHLASDAFFPFPDSIHKAAEAGIAAIIQPGGSKKDPDVIAACNECKLPMVFTGRRHFKH